MGGSILLLGGSAQQVVALDVARSLGYRTVLCDYLPGNPGRSHADSFYLVSTTDVDAVLGVAMKEHVGGVLAYASDPAALTAAIVAERLGLAGNPPEAVRILSEKHLFRTHLEKAGLAAPRSVSFRSDADPAAVVSLLESERWPIVVKPTDSSGSKGVTVIRNPFQIEAAVSEARRYSRNGVLIAEEYIPRGFSHVIGGDIFVADGEVRFWGLMSCLRDDGLGGLVPTGEMFPAGLPSDAEGAVKAALQNLVKSLGIRQGELNVEVIVSKNGDPYVLELAARAGGNMIPVQLSDASGVDLVAANIKSAMGEDPGCIDFDGHGDAYAHIVLHSPVPGIFRFVDYGALGANVYREVLYKSPGDEVARFSDAGDAVGIAFLKFKSPEEMRSALDGASAQRAKVVVE